MKRVASRDSNDGGRMSPTQNHHAILRRILEDAAALKEKGAHTTHREVLVLREAFNNLMKGTSPALYSQHATQCDNVLWQLEREAKENLSAQTGDEDRELKGMENWKFTQIPMARRRQMFVVTIFNFFTGLPFFLMLAIALTIWPFTMPFMILYWAWIFLKGVKHPLPRQTWWTRNSIFTLYRDYFPARLIIPKAVRKQIHGRRNYVFCYHPHGVHSFGAVVNFSTNANKIEDLLPGVKIHAQTLGLNFIVPFWRELGIPLGLGDASASCIRKTLRHGPGESILLVVGGAEESLLSSPKSNDLTLNKRRGFVKLALEVGAPLVPVFGFGETDCYGNHADGRPRLKKLLLKIQKTIGFAIPLVKGRGWFNYNFGPLPHRRQIVTVVGSPVELPKIEKPSSEDIDKWHDTYVEALLQLYHDNKDIYAQHMKQEARVVK